MAKEPPHFTSLDFIRAFFGSFIVSITFLFKGSMVRFALEMSIQNTIAVFVLTCLLLTFEIYMQSYRYVSDRKKRPFYEFWAKRFFSIIFASIISIYILIFGYGINRQLSGISELVKLTIAILLPAAFAGGAMEILKKKR